MPWLSLGYENPAVNKLKSILQIGGIPCLVMCDMNLEPVSADGVEAVKTTGVEGFPWLPSTVKDLNQEPDDINAKPCLVVFMEKCEEAEKDAKIEVLNEIADQIKDVVSIFYVRESGDVSNQIRGLIQNETSPLLAIIDIPDNGGFYLSESADATSDNIIALVQGFANKTVERKQMTA